MSKRILVVGGTGMIGSHVAASLRERGDQVAIASRSTAGPKDPPAIEGIERVAIDYTDPALTPAVLDGYEAIVFAAGNDIRHVTASDESEAYWRSVQIDGVPRFAQLSKDAGAECFIQLGSYYHQLHPEWAETDPYVAARKGADEGARAISGDGFRSITLNPPSIVGMIPSGIERYRRLVAWVRGELEGFELYGPLGGTNFMSVGSLVQAVEGALDRGEGGRAYVVGDENLHYSEYFQMIADAAGSTRVVEERDEESPFQMDRFIVQGRGNVISYEADPDETTLLGYTQNDIARALDVIVVAVDRAAA
jgi:dihydroflavonol-4-reductase